VTGNPEKLNIPWLGLFCSSKCPGSLILKAYDLSIALQKTGTPLISGFHSPVEKDALRIALRGEQNILVCPARGLEGMRIPVAYRKPLETGQLLLASIFSSELKRPTMQTAYERNRFVAALSEKVLIIHAEPGSKLISLCQEARSWGKPIYTLADPANDHLIGLGVKVISIKDIEDLKQF
jgi:predicted Rossmann fold nucleotide-binding protein DprA/Smf involved in DNA uptake